MAKNNKIIIPDTNFIREYSHTFIDVLKVLAKHGDVYMAEIIIEERLAQERMRIKKDYAEIESIKNKHKQYIGEITYKKTLDEKIKSQEDYLITNYKSVIGENIISFPKDEKTFSIVLERVHNKIPPFMTADNSSDKGFKDTLLWLSLLNFFTEYKEDKEIILITNDKGFISNIEILQKEFNEVTQKNIQICGSEFYQNLIADKAVNKADKATIKNELTEIEISELRLEINNAFESICIENVEDPFGNTYETPAFDMNGDINEEELRNYLEKFDEILQSYIFNKEIPIRAFFKGKILETHYSKSTEHYERVNNLYKKIRDNYSDYLQPFLSTGCSIINENCEGLPF